MLAAGALTAAGWFFWTAGTALFPFALGSVLAYILLPLVNGLERVLPWPPAPSARRPLAILLVYIAVFGTAGAGLAYLAPALAREAAHFLELLPTYVEDAQASLEGWTSQYRTTIPETAQTWVDQQVESAAAGLQAVGAAVALNAVQMVSATVSTVLGLFIIPVWLFFVLKDQPKAMPAFYGIFPPETRATARDIVFIVDYVLGRYVRAQLLLGLFIGLVTLIGLTALGIPFAPVLAVIGGIGELIPIVGPILGAVPAVLVVLATDPSQTVVVILLYWGIQILENNLLVPRIQGSALQLPPAIIMILLVAAAEVVGIWGMIVIVPVAAILRDVFVYLYRRVGGHLDATATEVALEARLAAVPSLEALEESTAGAARASMLAEARPEGNVVDRPSG